MGIRHGIRSETIENGVLRASWHSDAKNNLCLGIYEPKQSQIGKMVKNFSELK